MYHFFQYISLSGYTVNTHWDKIGLKCKFSIKCKICEWFDNIFLYIGIWRQNVHLRMLNTMVWQYIYQMRLLLVLTQEVTLAVQLACKTFHFNCNKGINPSTIAKQIETEMLWQWMKPYGVATNLLCKVSMNQAHT